MQIALEETCVRNSLPDIFDRVTLLQARPSNPGSNKPRRSKGSGNDTVYIIEVPDNFIFHEKAAHKKRDLDELLLRLGAAVASKNPKINTFEWLEGFIRTYDDSRASLELKLRNLKETLRRTIGFDEPQIMEYAKQIASLVWRSDRTGDLRDRTVSISLIDYINNARRVVADEGFANRVISEALEPVLPPITKASTRGDFPRWTFILRRLFTKQSIDSVIDAASSNNDEYTRGRAIDVMEQLVYSGSDAALNPDKLLQFLRTIEDMCFTSIIKGRVTTLNAMSGSPFSILLKAIDHKPELAEDPQIIDYFNKYLRKVEPLLTSPEIWTRHVIEVLKEKIKD